MAAMGSEREDRVAAAARAAGFPLVGCVPITPLPLDGYLREWLADGRAGEMGYLTKRTAVRLDPRQQFPWARSLVCVGFPYRPPAPAPLLKRALRHAREHAEARPVQTAGIGQGKDARRIRPR